MASLPGSRQWTVRKVSLTSARFTSMLCNKEHAGRLGHSWHSAVSCQGSSVRQFMTG